MSCTLQSFALVLLLAAAECRSISKRQTESQISGFSFEPDSFASSSTETYPTPDYSTPDYPSYPDYEEIEKFSSAKGFAGYSLLYPVGGGLTAFDCLKEVVDSADYSSDEVEKLGQTIRILQKLGKYNYLDEIDTTPYLSNYSVPNHIADSGSELSSCSAFLHQGDTVLETEQMESVVKSAMEYARVPDLSIFGETEYFEEEQSPDYQDLLEFSYELSSKGIYSQELSEAISRALQAQSQRLRNVVKEALNEWKAHTCLKFREMRVPVWRIRGNFLNFQQKSGCYSNVGKKSKSSGQTISLGKGCVRKYTAAHEIGHALGLWHEQARPDRDGSVLVKKENIPSQFLGQFMAQGFRQTETYGMSYDYGSIMHYSSTDFSKRKNSLTLEATDEGKQLTMGQRQQLSFYDVKVINDAYCSDKCVGPNTALCQNQGYPNPKNCAVCVCPQGLGGPTCEEAEVSNGRHCSGGKKKANGQWQTISVGGRKSCYYLIESAAGLPIEIEVQRMNFGRSGCRRTCENYLEVKTDWDLGLTGSRFCCSKPADTMTAHPGKAVVIYRGNNDGIVTLLFRTL